MHCQNIGGFEGDERVDRMHNVSCMGILLSPVNMRVFSCAGGGIVTHKWVVCLKIVV